MLRNVLAVIVGWFVGSVVNMSLIAVNMAIYPPPQDAAPGSAEHTAYMMGLPVTAFAIVWLAHIGGTFVGALVAALISRTAKFPCAMIVGVIFQLGGIMVSFLIPAPVLFLVLDLIAYLPAAWLGFLQVRILSPNAPAGSSPT